MLIKILKKVVFAVLIGIGVLVIAYLLFNSFYPSFGGDVGQERQVVYENSNQFKDGKFINVKAVPKDLSLGETLSLAYTFFTANVPNGRPKEDLKVEKLDSVQVADYRTFLFFVANGGQEHTFGSHVRYGSCATSMARR